MRALRYLLPVALVGGLLAFDVLELPAAEAVPVSPEVDSLDVGGVDPRAVRSQGVASRPHDDPAAGELTDLRPEVLTGPLTAPDEFGVLGVTWEPGEVDATEALVTVRVREDGGWSEWTELALADGAPDAGTAEAAQAADVVATAPLATSGADAVQVRIDTSTGEVPDGVEAVLVDPGRSAADDRGAGGAISTAGAAVGAPSVTTRAQWGADESRRSCTPSYSSTLKAAVVHHTAGTNSYGPGDSAGIVRGIYAYHTGTLGWCDIGYNVLVDRYGQVFEGRAGGLDRTVVGAHAGGFNASTFGISALGDFNTTDSPGVLTDAIAHVIAWKLRPHYADPLGDTQLTSAGGGTSKYPAGQSVTLPVILGHRDVGTTACPGGSLYPRLPAIRQRAAQLMGPGLVAPAVTATTAASGGTFGVSAGVVTEQGWHLKVVEACSGRLVSERVGTAARGRRIDTGWDTRLADGRAAPPGAYDLVLTSWAGGEVALGRTWSVTVTAQAASPAVGGAPTPQSGRFVPLGAPARLLDTRSTGQPLVPGDTRRVAVAGRGGVPASGATAVALNVTSTCVSGTGSSYVTVWPAGLARPATSSLNTGSADTTAGLVVSALGADGAVDVYNDTGTTQVIVDVMGYWTSDGAGAQFHQVAPRRVYDSRAGGGQPLTAGSRREVSLTGQPGTPASGMTAAVLNVTVAGAQGQGYVTVHPALQPRPGTSTLNLVPGADVANRATVGLTNNAFDVFLDGGPAHVVVDLVGYFAVPDLPAGSDYQPVTPARVLDTRTGAGGIRGAFGPGAELPVRVAGVGGVPADADAVVLTLTGTGASATTYATVWPAGTARPGTSDLNLRPGRTRANTVVADVGADGQVGLYNDRGATHLVVDVVGYYR